MAQIGTITTTVNIETGEVTVYAYYHNDCVASCAIKKDTDTFAIIKKLLWENKERAEDFKRLIAQYEHELCYHTDLYESADTDNFMF